MTLPQATCTIVIPCYDSESYLESAVRSVLAQSFRDYHLVLVDDASRDGTRALARRLAVNQPNMTVIELPENRGRSFARNQGAEVVRGPYVAFLDSDDTYHPDFLRVTTSALSQSPHLDAVKVLPNISIAIDPVRYRAVAGSLATTLLMRRAAFEFIGGWPQSMVFRQNPGGGEDIALQQLFSSCFSTGVIDRQLYNYLHRPGNTLDRFLSRSSVVDGRVVFHDGFEDDAKVNAEIRRLTGLLRQRLRQLVMERLAINETCSLPTARPTEFARPDPIQGIEAIDPGMTAGVVPRPRYHPSADGP